MFYASLLNNCPLIKKIERGESGRAMFLTRDISNIEIDNLKLTHVSIDVNDYTLQWMAPQLSGQEARDTWALFSARCGMCTTLSICNPRAPELRQLCSGGAFSGFQKVNTLCFTEDTHSYLQQDDLDCVFEAIPTFKTLAFTCKLLPESWNFMSPAQRENVTTLEVRIGTGDKAERITATLDNFQNLEELITVLDVHFWSPPSHYDTTTCPGAGVVENVVAALHESENYLSVRRIKIYACEPYSTTQQEIEQLEKALGVSYPGPRLELSAIIRSKGVTWSRSVVANH